MINIKIPSERLNEFCSRRHIHRLSLFGSVLRDDFRPDSDVDALVEFEPGHTPGFEFVSIQHELSAILGNHAVDLVSPKFLNRRIRDRILSEAELVYETK